MAGRLQNPAQFDLFSWSTPPQSTPSITPPQSTSTLIEGGVAPPPHKIPPYPPGGGLRGVGEGVNGVPSVEGVRGPGDLAGSSGPRPLTEGHGEPPRGNLRAGDHPRLRPYQEAAISAVEAEWARGNRRTLLELPTGTGKTVCFAEVARRTVATGKRALVVAHRTELLTQARNKLADVGVRAAIEQADQRAGRAPVVVGSVQSLRGARLAGFDPAEFGVVIVDEGHHAVSPGYRAILERFAGVRTLLVTATPDRLDGIGMRAVCDSVAFRYSMRAAIADQWLVPVLAKRVLVGEIDLSQVQAHHGDLDQRELAAVMSREKALHGTIPPLLELSRGRRTIAFAVDVAHAHACAEIANRYEPGVAYAIDGSADDDEREACLAAYRRGDFRVLFNCALYTEGFDDPATSCIALLRPTQSRALNTQMIGRGERILGMSYAESVANGKRDNLVLDFVGNAGKHKLVGPADALAGLDLPEEIRGDVEKALDEGQLDLEDVLAHAEQQATERRERIKLIALTSYRAENVDPFLGQLPPDPDGPWAKEPATPTQLRALTQAGFSKLPFELTRGEASRYIEALQDRRKRGLASLKQARRLHSLGLDVRNMTAVRAGQLFAKLTKRGWGPWVVRDEPEYRRGK